MECSLHDAEVCGEVSMFESVKLETDRGGIRYAASLLVSLVVHAVILCALVLVPLVFFNVLQAQELLTFLIEPPQPPPEPPAIKPPAPIAAAAQRPISNVQYGAPRVIPDGIPVADDTDPGPVIPNFALLQIPNIDGPGQASAKSFVGLVPELPKLPEPPKPQQRTPIRVASLEQSKLIYKVNPAYPPLAVKAHVQGTVILEAVIDEEGGVSTLKVLSGHPLLLDAAIQAVKQWKYSPTIMNGEPVSVIATVTVVFRMN